MALKNFALLFFILFSTLGFAEKYNIDLSHSSIEFKISHLTGKVKGRFESFSGKIEFDEKNLAKGGLTSAEIDVSSINTGNKQRDDHLKNEDFFDVSKFPKITFTTTKTKYNGKKKGKLTGKLNMKGVTRDVVLNVEFTGTAVDPWGNHRASFSATSKINRKDFGVTWNKILDKGGLLLGEEVEIYIEVEGIMEKEKEAEHKDHHH